MVNLTPKQKKFADGILEGKPNYVAAVDAYDIESPNKMNVGAVMAGENLKKPKIIRYLQNQGHGAATRIVQLSKNAINESVRLNANKDILDRAGVGTVDKSNIIPIQINISNILDKLEND